MRGPSDLTQLESHFKFGDNWAKYAKKIGPWEIAEGVKGLERLCGGRLDGKRFLDIGCGSGLHSLAALQLGAAEVVAVDIDPASVATTRAVLLANASDAKFRVEQASALDMDPTKWGAFDVVYSWGVLHHTGNMYGSLRGAASLVKPGGSFVFALYRKTWSCALWRLEKRWYAHASERWQAIASRIYTRLFALFLWLRGQRFSDYIERYRSMRGMDYYHDVHDWLGGYPYESITPEETDRFMRSLGFERESAFTSRGRFFGRDTGVFGSGCDEYAYRRN